eukprot:CAMPEP_0172373764 /NCGR_PEP_ID=MMETSP1060-20121228/53138_1 /TAXON_ID=37318 /ORGANISM="Pseudo-nitzschia pungens, Strain cf. cingulata" /LENGTH=372 /DNA_ID=CAMNT_0013100189 /DNA_START=125 /DNA_END=1243 /DNA_ORIENTATION=-
MTKPVASRLALLLLVSCLLLENGNHRVAAHARLECPPPLSGATGAKNGPCDALDDGTLEAFPLKANALNTITWLESISHPGAPTRFALSGEGGDAEGFENCVLLDHVPHDALSRPMFLDALSWHRNSITLWIPDVYCERCHLQLVSVMSDRQHGVPADAKCVYKGAAEAGTVTDEHPICPAVYHSCAPVSIDGSVPRSDIDFCNTTEFETKLDWPLTPSSDADLYQHSVYFNRGDVGIYTESDARLQSVGAPLTDDVCTNPIYCDPEVSFDTVLEVPETAPYASLEGSCASVTGMKVEAYAADGSLPSVPKDATDPPEGLDDVDVDVDVDGLETSGEELDPVSAAVCGRGAVSSIIRVTITIIAGTILLSSF